MEGPKQASKVFQCSSLKTYRWIYYCFITTVDVLYIFYKYDFVHTQYLRKTILNIFINKIQTGKKSEKHIVKSKY